MNKQQKIFACLLGGAAAGAAIAWFLQTEKGKELAESLKTSFKDFAEDAKEKISARWNDLDKGVEGLLKKGKSLIEDVEDKPQDVVS